MRRFKLPRLDDLLSRRNFDDLEPPSLVIVGLGNPGDKYTRTRHNAGFWFIDRLAKKHSITLERRHQSALIGEGVIGDDSVVLVKPRTFVNRSGEAVRYLLARYRIKPDKLLIVYDEINLPPGKLRLRPGGSAGGHNGIRSIIESAGTQEFPRLRIGVGRQEDGDSQIDHVLGKLPPDEQKAVDDAIERGVDAVSNLLTEGIDRAMNKFN